MTPERPITGFVGIILFYDRQLQKFKDLIIKHKGNKTLPYTEYNVLVTPSLIRITIFRKEQLITKHRRQYERHTRDTNRIGG